jgi:hypothetical protein
VTAFEGDAEAWVAWELTSVDDAVGLEQLKSIATTVSDNSNRIDLFWPTAPILGPFTGNTIRDSTHPPVGT